MRQFQQSVLACSFCHHQIFQTSHVHQACFACQQANVFDCQQANVGSSVHACQFCHADLVAGETGKQSDHALNSDVGQTVLASFVISRDSVFTSLI